MTPPTFPSLWSDVLTQLNAFLAWDLVKGFLVITFAILLGAATVAMVTRVAHRG